MGERRQKPRQVSASFAVFCDGRRTPRLRVLSLLRLCSGMLERARESEREREEGCGDLHVRGVQRERERCAVSARNMLAKARGSERRGAVICKVLGVQRERERCAVSARNMLAKEGEGARGGCGALSLLDIYIYIYIYSERERDVL